MENVNTDPIELKKKILMPYLDFVEAMLIKVKGTSIESKWKVMHECITSDKKRPTFQQIKQMEKTLADLKSQSREKNFIVSSKKSEELCSGSLDTNQKNEPKMLTPAPDLFDDNKKIDNLTTLEQPTKSEPKTSTSYSDTINQNNIICMQESNNDGSNSVKPNQSEKLNEKKTEVEVETIQSTAKGEQDSKSIEDLSHNIQSQSQEINCVEDNSNDTSNKDLTDTEIKKSLDKPSSSKTANVLTSLLEDDEDNPEKILEGLMTVLGTEKLKKMQELLLKKSIVKDTEQEMKKSEDNNEIIESKSGIQDEKSIGSAKVDKEISDQGEPKTDTSQSDTKLLSESETLGADLQDNAPIPQGSSSNPAKTNTNSAESIANTDSKTQKKRSRKKLNELDRLHSDLLRAHDFEAIMRASVQPRVSVKPKIYEDQSLLLSKSFENNQTVAKSFETIPFSINLVRLKLPKEMPVKLNDESTKKLLGIYEPLSKPGPLSKKIKLKSKSSEKLPLETIVKKEPEAHDVINEVKIIKAFSEPTELIQSTKKLIIDTKNEAVIKKKKKRKNLLWSKGIVKKRPKRTQYLRHSEWEDIESDNEANYEAILKLNKFKDIFSDFAFKCGFGKLSKNNTTKQAKKFKSKISTNVDASQNETVLNQIPEESYESETLNNSNQTPELINMSHSPEKEQQNQSFKILNIPKRINLPIQKNILTVLSKSCNSSENSLQEIIVKKDKSPNLSIKLPTINHAKTQNTITETAKTDTGPNISGKLPTIENSKTPANSNIQRMESGNEILKRPIELSSNTISIQSSSQNVVVVKPISRRDPIESIKVRTLSVQEQQALKAALSNSKNVSSNIVIKNNIVDKLTNVNPSLSISKINVHKSSKQTDEKSSNSTDNSEQKSLPMISSVISFNSNSSQLPVIESVNHSRPHNTSSQVDTLQFKRRKIEDTSSDALNIECPEEFLDINESVMVEPSDNNDLEEIVPVPPEVEIVDLIDDDDDDIIDYLRPWIEKAEFKSKKLEAECNKMVNNTHCLASLFKCMSSSCGYFTNSTELFQFHLELHREHQNDDSLNYLLCCYCNFRPNSISLLVTHLEMAHGYAKYGCRYCFYRSVNEYQVTANHHMNFHRNKEKCVIVFEPKKFKNENTEKNYISKTIPNVVPVLSCPYCRIGFYTIAEFKSHVLDHKETYSALCKKCDQPMNKQNVINHYIKCYTKYGNYQCVFCVFGTSSFSTIDNHLSIEHPDKMSYFAERILNQGKDPTSIESLTIKELSKKITGNVKKVLLNYSFDDEIFRNAGNVGNISQDLVFHQNSDDDGVFSRHTKVYTSSLPTESTKKSLQICQVISLND